MSKTSLKPGVWQTVLGLMILILGLTSAVLVYDAPTSQGEAREYRIFGNRIFPIQNEDTKQHVVELEIYGGNAAVIVDSFNRKLINFFKGKNLAIVLAIVSIILAVSCFLAAWRAKKQ